MRRYQLLEIEDQPWCPKVLRDCATDFLQHMLNLAGNYHPVAPRLRDLLIRTGETQVVDLCSGGGGPWLSLHRLLEEEGPAGLQVRLTDLYPNREAFERMQEQSRGAITFHPEPVDATRVPEALRGLRTLFSAFHHFPPKAARRVLEDAARSRQPIAIFEATHRSPLSLFAVSLSPLFVLLVTPAIRPFRVSRLIWTYLLPLIPLLVLFDGIVSCLRVYTPSELLELTSGLAGDDYHWEAGEDRQAGPLPITYLIGRPVAVGSEPDGCVSLGAGS